MMVLVEHNEDTMVRAGFVHGVVLVAQIEEREPALGDDRPRFSVTIYPRGATDVVDWVADVRATDALALVRRERPDLRDVHLTGERRGVVVVDRPVAGTTGIPVAIGVQIGVSGSRS